MVEFTHNRIFLTKSEADTSGLPRVFPYGDLVAESFGVLDQLVYLDHMLQKARDIAGESPTEFDRHYILYIEETEEALKGLSARMIKECLGTKELFPEDVVFTAGAMGDGAIPT